MSTRVREIMIYSISKLSLLISISFLLVLFAVPSAAQGSIGPGQVGADQSAAGEQRSSGPLEDEMRAKRAIKYAEAEYKENLDRARELCDVASKLQTSIKGKKALDREDAKRLDRIEKLAKGLRSKAGGSSSEIKIEKAPADLETAIGRVAEMSTSLSELVQKTPRRVVSAAVIDEANVLLELIDIVRKLPQ
jgi:TolA-binding protein